jgi:hypothetical protein
MTRCMLAESSAEDIAAALMRLYCGACPQWKTLPTPESAVAAHARPDGQSVRQPVPGG